MRWAGPSQWARGRRESRRRNSYVLPRPARGRLTSVLRHLRDQELLRTRSVVTGGLSVGSGRKDERTRTTRVGFSSRVIVAG